MALVVSKPDRNCALSQSPALLSRGCCPSTLRGGGYSWHFWTLPRLSGTAVPTGSGCQCRAAVGAPRCAAYPPPPGFLGTSGHQGGRDARRTLTHGGPGLPTWRETGLLHVPLCLWSHTITQLCIPKKEVHYVFQNGVFRGTGSFSGFQFPSSRVRYHFTSDNIYRERNGSRRAIPLWALCVPVCQVAAEAALARVAW